MKQKRIVLRSFVALLGSGILAFGLYHVHSFSGVTEGGQLGLTLLLHHWFAISPALSSALMNMICYVIGWRTLGKPFLFYSAISALGFSITYRVCEFFPPLWPQLTEYPLIAALLGALFVGIGCGLCVRVGGAPSGDDALVMSLSKRYHIKIEYVYVFFDVSVLLLSLSYIPLRRIIYSLLTVTLSSKLVGVIHRMRLPSFMQKRLDHES